tara:strand:+ start:387 stop:1487 length:1101 start_codon:yes stop_codon:yes gene_type:complete
MENNNITNNLLVKQLNQSDAMAYNLDYLASPIDTGFNILNKAYANTGRLYAHLKLAIQNNKCVDENCEYESRKISELEKAPQDSLDFLADLVAEVSVTEEPNFDPNNNFTYTVISSIFKERPGFSKSDGYSVDLSLLENGGQEISFSGPGIPGLFVINNTALKSLVESGTSLVASTPDINKDMSELLKEVGVFDPEMFNDKGELKSNAKISETFVMKDVEGNFDYEIVDLGNNKGRNILKYDIDKIDKKATPFINAEIAGLFSSEQSAVAAWNVYISKETSVEEDDQMVQNANAGSKSWSYEKDLPLTQANKVLFEKKYKKYFMNNYLKQFTKNQIPSVEADAAVFDLAESKKAKAQKFMDDNDLN